MENKITLDIPYGTRDSLPEEAKQKRAIKTKLAKLFSLFGYEEVETPIVEYVDTLTMGGSKSLEPNMLKLFDGAGRAIAIRHEMTTPIARLAVSRLDGSSLPLKLSYIANVYRIEELQTGRRCEFCQAGVELMGSESAAADAEIVALCAKSIRDTGVRDFRISLGQAAFVQGLMNEYRLAANVQKKIKNAMEKRDLVKLERIADSLDIDDKAKAALKRIPYLIGGEKVLAEARAVVQNDESLRAVENLFDIYRLLKRYRVEDYVTFDLGIARDFGYYTGMVFEAYAKGLGFPLAGGGRYDEMLGGFGSDLPATGFSVGVDRLMLALSRQHAATGVVQKCSYVAYAEGCDEDATKKAEKLRDEGAAAKLSFAPQTRTEAEAAMRENGCTELVYCE